MDYNLIGLIAIIVGMFIMISVGLTIENILTRIVEAIQSGNKRMARDQLLIKESLEEVKKYQGGYVTDPFKVANSSHTPGASSDNIIKRKTPDQIRSENFEKIKKGQTYGHID